MYFENRFTEKATNALKLAHESAVELGHSYVGSEHLLLGLLREGESVAARALQNVGITEEKAKNAIIEAVGQGNSGAGVPQGMTPRTKRIIEFAAAEAARLSHNYIGTEHLLMGMIREGENVAIRLLSSMNVDLRALYKSIIAMTGSEREESAAPEQDPAKTAQGVHKSSTKTLDQFSRDLTDMARRGKLDPVIGRDKEIERVIQILSRRQKNNPALIGEPGVGKTAVAEGLARKIAAGQVPE
ncbi:MAG: Clp protease N-terminal domain-containing protein, partial [Bacillota bacterium]|nr:Clp protease N-terminal domain-containing protein [Bacillota bacterium]